MTQHHITTTGERAARRAWATPELAILAAAEAENSPIPVQSDGALSLGS